MRQLLRLTQTVSHVSNRIDRAAADIGSETSANQKRSDNAGRSSGAAGGDPGDSVPTEEELPLDLVFEILKNERRRQVLQYLWAHEEPATLGAVAEHIAAIENDTTVEEISSSERKRVYVGLYQLHLPKMHDAGIIVYNQGRGLLELTPLAHQLETYLDRETESDPTWDKYQLGFALAGVVLTAVVGFGVLAHTPITDAAIVGIFLVIGILAFLQGAFNT